MAVRIDGSVFYPIEASGSLTASKGSERTRLDLTLGEDANHDGLRDAWQEWQLYHAGYYPDENGVWPLNLIPKYGDLDGDGQTNWQEYLAGTFAGDANDKLTLTIKEKLATTVRLECYAITGKTYTLESSPDLITWTRVAFSVGAPAVGAQSYTGASVGILPIFTPPAPPGVKEFCRLTVR